MEWLEYKGMSVEHIAHISKMKLLVYYSTVFFNNFPENLDIESKNEFYGGLKIVHKNLGESLKSKEGFSLEISNIMADTILVYVSEIINAKAPNKGVDKGVDKALNFDELIFTQALVMNYARIDAFFNDTISCICELKPEIMIHSIENNLKKNEGLNEKNISWKEIIKFGSYETIIEFIKDDFIYKLGLKSLDKKVCFLKDKLGFDIKGENINLNLLYEGERYRHSIIHRGGIVDNRLLGTSSLENINKGDKILIDQEYLWKIYEQSMKLINVISTETIIKYFKINLDDESVFPKK